MFEKDHQVTMQALLMWANFIETGSVTASAKDLQNMGKASEIKPLADNQKAMVERLRKLASAQGMVGMGKGFATHQAEPVSQSAPVLDGAWKLESGVHICRVGKVKVAQITCIANEGESELYLANSFMPGIPADLGNHETLDLAKAYASRAVKAWVGALSQVAA